MRSNTRDSRATQSEHAGAAPAPRRRSLIAGAQRALLAAFGLLVLLALLGASYQLIATAIDARRFPPSGLLVDVRGYRLHLHIQGADRGGPTVLLDAGQGSASPQWAWVQRELAAQARVVSIDRPGMGYSDPLPPGVDARGYVADLRAALASLNLAGPYILVVHSMGALTSRAFAAEHPAEVAGVVLVDPRDLDIVAFSRTVFPKQPVPSAELTLAERWLGPLAARLGLMRLANMLGIYVDQLPAEEAGRARAMLASTGYWDNFIPDALLGESAAQLLANEPELGSLPLIVLSAGEPDMGFPPDSRARFVALREGLAQTLSSRGRHVLVLGADHFSGECSVGGGGAAVLRECDYYLHCAGAAQSHRQPVRAPQRADDLGHVGADRRRDRRLRGTRAGRANQAPQIIETWEPGGRSAQRSVGLAMLPLACRSVRRQHVAAGPLGVILNQSSRMNVAQ